MFNRGDKVACIVKNPAWTHKSTGEEKKGPGYLDISTVDRVHYARDGREFLILVEYPGENGVPFAFHASVFRKVVPDKQEPADAEFMNLLKKKENV